jgi:hypothetical protein
MIVNVYQTTLRHLPNNINFIVTAVWMKSVSYSVTVYLSQ